MISLMESWLLILISIRKKYTRITNNTNNIICYRKSIPLQWSEFPIKHNWKDVIVKFTATMVTRSLSLNDILESRLERLKLINFLYESGGSSIEIADHLNENGILTPTGKAYYPKLVWVTQNNFKLRIKRRFDNEYVISDVRFSV